MASSSQWNHLKQNKIIIQTMGFIFCTIKKTGENYI